MADIAGIGGTSGIDAARANAADNQRAEEEELRAQEAASVEATGTEAVSEAPATSGTGVTEATDTDQSATAQGEREINDQVTLSAEAQAIVQETAADEFATANDTNQQERDEDRTGVVNGNQDNQSEQTRALGQIVDQFA